MGIYGINLNLEIQTAQNLRLAQQTLNCSKSTIKILEKGIKSVQVQQLRLLNDVIDVIDVFIISATRTRRDIKIPLRLSVPVRKSLI